MSVPVALEALEERLAQYGPHAHLVTVSDAALPHVVSVVARLEGGALRTGAGRTTAANVAANPGVTLLWAAPPGEDYCLIVDGAAEVDGDQLAVRPSRAVLHRLATAPGEGPSCIDVLPRD